MGDTERLNVGTELRGMKVVDPDSRKALGTITDVIIHPTAGVVLGYRVLTAAGDERVILAPELRFQDSHAAAAEYALMPRQELAGVLAGGAYACCSLKGASVVTEDGRLLGRIADVFIAPGGRAVSYRVAEPGVQGMLNEGFFMNGSLPHSYSATGARLIVPARTGREGGDGLAITSRLFAQGRQLLDGTRRFIGRYGVPLWVATTTLLFGSMLLL